MKKHIALLLAILSVFSLMALSACSETSTDLADYNLEDYVNLCDYKGIKITRKNIVVDDDDVKAAVNEMLDEYAETADLKEGDVLQLNDKISVTYVGKVNGEYEGLENGKEIANTGDNEDEFVIGKGGHIPGFDDSFIGHHPGDEFSFDVTFPKPYTINPKLEGVKVTFSGIIHSATRDVQPEYTDAFVAEHTDFETIAEYEEHVLADLREAADEKEMLDEVSAIWEKIMKESEVIRYPEAVVEARYNESMEKFEAAAKANNITVENLAKSMYNMSLDEFESAMRTQSQQLVFEEMILMMIIDREGITISDKEYAEGLADYAEKNNETDVQGFEEKYGSDTIRENLLWDKTLMYLLEKAEISDAGESTDDKAAS